MIVNGIDTIDVTSAASSLGFNHNAYAEDDALLMDVARMLQRRERVKPGDRSKAYQEIKTDAGSYWLYQRP